MNPTAKYLIIAGGVLILAGIFWQFAGRHMNLGRLPGDINIEGDRGSFHFPVVTCIIISIVLTVALNLIGRFLGK